MLGQQARVTLLALKANETCHLTQTDHTGNCTSWDFSVKRKTTDLQVCYMCEN